MGKKRRIAIILSLFVGFTGIHYLYLGETLLFVCFLAMNLSIVCIPFAFLYALIGAYQFYKMSDYTFNMKYNKKIVKGSENLPGYLKHLEKKITDEVG